MSVQLENGFTKIAHELLETIPFYKFNGTQFSILIVIIRYTYGFNRKDHELSLTYLTKATGIKRSQIDRELTLLIDKKVVSVTQESTATVSRKLALNKHYDQWLIERRYPLIRGQSPNQSIPELGSEVSPNQGTQGIPYLEDKDIYSSSKDNLKDINIVPFEEIITYLNQKAGTKFKHNTVNTKKHINARWNENYRLIDFERVIDKKCAEWLGNDMEQYLCPDTLFGTKFEKYLNQKILLKGGQPNAKYGTGHGGRTNAELDALSF